MGIEFANAIHNLETAKTSKTIAIHPDRINFLMADESEFSSSMEMLVSGEQGKERLKRFWVENWTTPDQGFKWELNTPEDGNYLIDVRISAPPGTEIEIQGPQGKLRFKTQQTPDRWNWHWDRISLPEPLFLPKGISSITAQLTRPLSITDESNSNEACLKSLEFVHVDYKPELEAQIKASRANTEWLRDAKFGIMLQWGEWGYPRHGDKKEWPGMIDDFDVEQFAEKIASTRAGYVLWSATWRTYYFPAPIKAIDDILPGRTSKRDLIGELADALAKRGIKLVLYYHLGHDTTPENGEWWSHNWVSWDDKQLFLDNWSSIVREVGERYGDKLAGWFFDDGLIFYPAPFEELSNTAKAGYQDRLISYNPWIQARDTDFQEIFFGEAFQWRNDLPVGGSGIFPDGPHKGLLAHSNFIVEDGPGWGIWQPDTEIKGHHYTREEAIKMALHAAERNYILSWNILMYEDGYIWEETLELLREVGNAVREKY